MNRSSDAFSLLKNESANCKSNPLKQKNGLEAFLPLGLNRWHLLCYLLILIICFLFFNQGDLNHTVRSSYALLNGHILDFYDYNKAIEGENSYLPILYIVFAIWNLPIYCLGLTSDLSNGPMFLNTAELVWSKLLLALFFAGTIFLLNKCSELLSNNKPDKNASIHSALFATSPIAIFAVFIFSQYDIIGCFFTILALYYYIKKNLIAFAWLFSIAIGFKFFALVIYLPLLLFAEKRFQGLLKLLLIGALITFLQFLIYWHSQAFQIGIFAVPYNKTGGLNFFSHALSNLNTYYLLAYLFLCGYAYMSKYKDDDDFYKHAVFIPIIAYGLMFASISWNPQWLIIIMPFFSLSYKYINNKKLFYIVETIGMLSFTWISVNLFVNNVDASMLCKGVLSSLFEPISLRISDLMLPKYLLYIYFLFRLYLFSPILIYTLQKPVNISIQEDNENFFFYYIRFILGISFFVLPSFYCALKPF